MTACRILRPSTSGQDSNALSLRRCPREVFFRLMVKYVGQDSEELASCWREAEGRVAGSREEQNVVEGEGRLIRAHQSARTDRQGRRHQIR